MSNHTMRRSLFLIGGAADSVLIDFVAVAGGKDARVALVPHATGLAKERSTELTATLVGLGVPRENITTLMPDAAFTIPGGTTAVYIIGGSQNRLLQLLNRGRGSKWLINVFGQRFGRWLSQLFSGTCLDELKRFYREGGLVAGTSAGSAAVGETMIAGGLPEGDPATGPLLLARGLGLIENIVVDTHFGKRNRGIRLTTVVASGEADLGIGLDEDTAVLLTEDGGTVFGPGLVWVYRPVAGSIFEAVLAKAPEHAAPDHLAIEAVEQSPAVMLEQFPRGSSFRLS